MTRQQDYAHPLDIARPHRRRLRDVADHLTQVVERVMAVVCGALYVLFKRRGWL